VLSDVAVSLDSVVDSAVAVAVAVDSVVAVAVDSAVAVAVDSVGVDSVVAGAAVVDSVVAGANGAVAVAGVGAGAVDSVGAVGVEPVPTNGRALAERSQPLNKWSALSAARATHRLAAAVFAFG
jgi:hypothetical protein